MSLWAVVLVLSALIAGCKKPDDDLGLNLLPGDPLGTVIDTTRLRAYTFVGDPLRTSGLTRQLLGSHVDPQFGSAKAGIVTQITLSANNIGTGLVRNDLVADSLVLSLAFDGINFVYGNLDPQVVRVFELSEDLSLDSLYHHDRVPQFMPMDLVAGSGRRITPQPLAKPVVLGDTLDPQLRIRLDRSLAERFLDGFNMPELASSDAFVQFFKGLYITVDNGTQLPFQAGIMYFNLLASASKVTLYYRDTVSDPSITVPLDFLINSNCVRYTEFQHDPAQAVDAGLVMALADTTAPAPTTYVRAFAGARTAFRMPTLMDQASEDRVLAKAELILPVQGSYYPYYPPPVQMFLFRKDSLGKDVFLPDQLQGIGAVDGVYRADERAYRFNITRYVQQVLNGRIPNNGFEVSPGSSGISANRAVLNGPDALENPARLRLTFTSY